MLSRKSKSQQVLKLLEITQRKFSKEVVIKQKPLPNMQSQKILILLEIKKYILNNPLIKDKITMKVRKCKINNENITYKNYGMLPSFCGLIG